MTLSEDGMELDLFYLNKCNEYGHYKIDRPYNIDKNYDIQ